MPLPPPGLLDLTFYHLARRPALSGEYLGQCKQHPAARRMHQAALASGSSSRISLYSHLKTKTLDPTKTRNNKPKGRLGGLQVRSVKGKETQTASNDIAVDLAQRVQQLAKIAENTAAVVAQDTFAYSEDELTALYQDTMADPLPNPLRAPTSELSLEEQVSQDAMTLDAAYHRLQDQLSRSDEDYLDSPFVQTLRSRISSEARSAPKFNAELQEQPHRILLAQVEAFLQLVDPQVPQLAVPVVVLTLEEWEALVRISVSSQDVQGAELALQLMQRTAIPITEQSVNGILEHYSKTAQISEFERALSTYVAGPPTERQKHLHVRVHLRATPPNTIPKTALDVLHAYEAKMNLPTIKTYTNVITALFRVRDSMANAHAWDLYTHTRYVAHPNPDPFLYTTMIRACASPSFTARSGDPERALDLWTEMTVDHKLPPTVATYNALILACARSGRKRYVDEAYRLAKEMLELYQDAQGKPTMTPDQRTFYALLEGAKRIGDLVRARWILAKLSSIMAESGSPEICIDEEVMMHVLHTYTTYDPPFTRNLAPMKEGGTHEDRPSAEQSSSTNVVDPPSGASPSFAHVPPQSRSEVLAEVDALFYRCIAESAAVRNSDSAFDSTLSFGNVKMSTRVVNSYLSVHYKHGKLADSRVLWRRVFGEAGVERNARTFREALEKCMLAKRYERDEALEFGREVFAKYIAYEKSGKEEVDARTIEKVHVAYIRLLALTDNLREAVAHIKVFMAKYPPNAVRQHPRKPAMRSTRTSLYAARPLVRMSSTPETPDSYVPPLLMFRDLDVVHHRCVHKGYGDGIAYVKYVCSAYEWAMRVRRDNAFKARPVTEKGEEVPELEEEQGVGQEWV